jgi:hypothetical protein
MGLLFQILINRPSVCCSVMMLEIDNDVLPAILRALSYVVNFTIKSLYYFREIL